MDQNKILTIKDIAQKAGVSISTVSRTMNNSELVSKKTKKKVERVISDNNYIPNEVARGLVRRKSKTVALIIPDISNPFYAKLFCGIEEVMSSEGYYVFVCNTNYLEKNEHRYVKEMISHGVDGMMFMSLHHCGDDIFDLVRKNTKAVAIQSQINDMDIIRTDITEPGHMAIRHLKNLGHKKIAFVCLDRNTVKDRYLAYIQGLETSEVEFREEYIIEGYTADTLGYMAVNQLMELNDPPTAIQFLNDYTAIGAYRAIMEKGMRIPEDMSVIGYDDIEISSLLTPKLTTIRQPIVEMGRIAGEVLLKNINSKINRVSQEIILPCEFVIRSSTAPPK